VKLDRVMAGVGAVALCAAGGLAMSSVGAAERPAKRAAVAPRVATPIWAGSFTPAAADPRLAALFARAGVDSNAFRFTPAEPRRSDRAVTVAIRVRSNRATTALAAQPVRVDTAVAAAAPTVGIAPIAYNLGLAVGWKRFAVSGDLAKIDLGPAPGSHEAVGVGLSFAATKRLTGQLHASADRPLTTPGTPQFSSDAPSYSIDVGGAYRLTHNLDVTAGVRYKADRDRLDRALDDRRDSQAVYVGTAFRF